MSFLNIDLKLKIKKYRIWIISFLAITYFSNFFDKIFSPINEYLLEKLKGLPLALYGFMSYLLDVKIPAYSLVIGILITWLGNKIYKIFKIRSKKFKIISAVYGKDDNVINIANILNDRIENDKLKIVLDNNIAGDPIVGTLKEGIITYKYNDILYEKKYTERDVVELP